MVCERSPGGPSRKRARMEREPVQWLAARTIHGIAHTIKTIKSLSTPSLIPTNIIYRRDLLQYNAAARLSQENADRRARPRELGGVPLHP